MAKYGINKEGADSLKQLANDLGSINKEIEENGTKLKTKISSLSDNLGIYENQILELVENVNKVQRKGVDSIQKLSDDVKKKASEVEALVSSGF